MLTDSVLAGRALDYVVKASSTALVRQMARGLLSPQTITRAATAMSPGKFRFVRHLGRGQFNMADEVVGNVGGEAGRMVRKLPSHAYPDASHGYAGVKPLVDKLNKQYPSATGAPMIAPYVDVNSRGAFQRFGDQVVQPPGQQRHDHLWKHPIVSDGGLGDLHSGNVGPGGQIIDFTHRTLPWPSHATPRVNSTGVSSGRIPGGEDLLANRPTMTADLARQNANINNQIRRFYDRLTPETRAAEARRLEAVRAFEMQQLAATTPYGVIPPRIAQNSPARAARLLASGGLLGAGAAAAGYSLPRIWQGLQQRLGYGPSR